MKRSKFTDSHIMDTLSMIAVDVQNRYLASVPCLAKIPGRDKKLVRITLCALCRGHAQIVDVFRIKGK